MRGVKAGEVWMIDFGMAAKVRFNRRHKLSGHLFAGRYKSLLIDGAVIQVICAADKNGSRGCAVAGCSESTD